MKKQAKTSQTRGHNWPFRCLDNKCYKSCANVNLVCKTVQLSRQDNDRTGSEKKVEKMKYSGETLQTLWPLITKYGRALVDVSHHQLLRCFISTFQSSTYVKTIFALSDIVIDKICLVFHLFRLVRNGMYWQTFGLEKLPLMPSKSESCEAMFFYPNPPQ